MQIIDTYVLEKKLLYLLHRALVDIRNLSMAGRAEQVTELADLFELLPSLMADSGDSDLCAFQTALQAYERKHGEYSYEYSTILEMDDQDFTRLYASW